LSGGAVLGVAVTFCLGLQITLGIPAIIGFALLGGLLTMFIVLIIRRAIRCDINSMRLVCIMISFATSSITTLLMSLTTHENLSQIISWSIGSMDSASEEMAIVIVVAAIVATLISAFLGNIINALSLGATEAQHIGINSQKMIIILFVVATLMAAVSVAAVGVVAFVGMIIPHIIRRIAGHDHRYILPLAAMGGSSFMLLCDIAARTIIYPRELPSGVITGICGCIMFIYLTSRQRNEHN
ncbi:MAG: iron ABC transporter permease, partial [Bacteroidales bacterium]|nr:iron ABC transporter permease [Bacteroidales bacterium]